MKVTSKEDARRLSLGEYQQARSERVGSGSGRGGVVAKWPGTSENCPQAVECFLKLELT